MADAMVSMGDYAVGKDARHRNQLRLAVTGQLAHHVLRVRMLGSAATDLAWLAEGKTDACIILGSHPWDIAAGVIIATEAGAKIVDLDGAAHTLRAEATIAATPRLIADITRLVAEAQSDLVLRQLMRDTCPPGDARHEFAQPRRPIVRRQAPCRADVRSDGS